MAADPTEAFTLARAAARRAAALVVDSTVQAALAGGFITEPPSAAARQQLIDQLMHNGAMTIADVVAALGAPRIYDPLPKVKELPNVLWDWRGVFLGLKRWLSELEDQLTNHVGDRVMEESVTPIISQLLRQRDALGRLAPATWRFWLKYCLPQWSKGRKDQPNNRRLQQRPGRNADGKPHSSPLGNDW